MSKANEQCKRIVIVCRGDSDVDFERAFDHAVSGVKEGYVFGHNGNDAGAYYFKVTTDVTPGEWPE